MPARSVDRGELLGQVRRLVVKIGSSSLTTREHQLDQQALRQLVADVVELRGRGIQVAIVSSGAVAAGMGQLGLEQRPRAVAELQATAAVGQIQLMDAYRALFWQSQVHVGQVLLTADDVLGDRRRYLNLENTFRSLFAYGAVPVINENDSVAVAELKRRIGENDMLAAYVANLIRARLLVMLSDVDGLYEGYGRRGPEGDVLGVVHSDDAVLDNVTDARSSDLGSGGIRTKVRAARLLMACGEMSLLAHARRHRLVDLVAGAELGTLFVPGRKRLRSRKRWIAFASESHGSIVVDRGAQRAITENDRSLLPAGVVACSGDFGAGDIVQVLNEAGSEIARGRVRYAAGDLQRVLGLSSPGVAAALGRAALEVIHRDDLALLV